MSSPKPELNAGFAGISHSALPSPKRELIKSVLHDCVITVQGSKMYGNGLFPIKITIKVLELNYGPCLDWTLSVDVPYDRNDPDSWTDHPLMMCRDIIDKSRDIKAISCAGEILDDTPAVRAMLSELCATEKSEHYTGTDCTHRARLIAALEKFWS